MRKINFITKERIYRFSELREEMAMFYFLAKYIPTDKLNRAFKNFDVRTDTRYMCDDKYASVVPYKDENGRILDVEIMIMGQRIFPVENNKN